MEYEIIVESVETETPLEELYKELLYHIIINSLSEVIKNGQGSDISESVH